MELALTVSMVDRSPAPVLVGAEPDVFVHELACASPTISAFPLPPPCMSAPTGWRPPNHSSATGLLHGSTISIETPEAAPAHRGVSVEVAIGGGRAAGTADALIPGDTATLGRGAGTPSSLTTRRSAGATPDHRRLGRRPP